jgi:hypothetical protein
LSALQRDGILQHVIIYSNNNHLQSLEWIRDLIHEHTKNNHLIADCIHWDHPLRQSEKILQHGYSNKTWSVLKNIMVTGHCHASDSLSPEQVHFFDDLEHIDLKRTLNGNYHMVPAYQFRTSFERISSVFREAMDDADVDASLLSDYVIRLFGVQNDVIHVHFDNDAETIIDLFREKTNATAEEDRLPPLWDSGIHQMMEVVQNLRYEMENPFFQKNIFRKHRRRRTRRGGRGRGPRPYGRSNKTNSHRSRTHGTLSTTIKN